ncbi:gp53-like domain-containing protein, partial [Budvicia aquatica]|uniref:gp53-like domain-containing protein n=1 Tax=Budvicia aquatica TaxID=82979 RepID=UPI004039AB4C
EAAKRSGVTALNSPNGWLSIPSMFSDTPRNTIIQWGTVSMPISTAGGIGGWVQSTTTFPFPISFPNACFATSCSLLHGGSSTQWVAIAQIAPHTNTIGRALMQSFYPLETAPLITWMAIGY